MKNVEFLKSYSTLTLLLIVIGLSNPVFSQTKAEPPTPKFLILIETTSDGFKLTAEEGCSWKELRFTVNPYQPQAIDQNGMTSLNTEAANIDSDPAAFHFIIKKTKEGISLEGKKGTAWTQLSFSCENVKCHQYVNENGMITKG